MRFPFRLSFLLPEGADIEHALNCCYPFNNGCDVDVHGAGLVVIGGPSRDALLTSAGEFMRALCIGITPQSIAARMNIDERPGAPGGSDTWTVAIGAEVAFFATGLPPFVPALRPARPPPQLEEVDR